MDKILFDQIPDLFASVGNLFIEKKEELCEMDARLGDGDLGLTMSKRLRFSSGHHARKKPPVQPETSVNFS